MLISNANNNIYIKKNDEFNTIFNKGFIKTQSIKRSKKFIKDWALDPKGFKSKLSYKTYDITKIDENELRNNIFYKDIWYKENKNNEHFIL